MPLEYEDLREAWGDAQRHAGAKVSKRPLECPMWWAWACETAAEAMLHVFQESPVGEKLLESTWERQRFCQEQVADLSPRQVFTMYIELGLGGADDEGTSPLATPTEQARAAVAEAAGSMLDELVGFYMEWS